MDYISANNDYLINFRKIKYSSARAEAEEAKRLEQKVALENARRNGIKERNAAKSNVEVTRELSAMKKKRGAQSGKNMRALQNERTAEGMRVSSRKELRGAKDRIAFSQNTKSDKRNAELLTADGKHKKTTDVREGIGAKSARRGIRINVKTAAEFLNYSCEERTYCDTESSGEKTRFPVSFFVSVVVVTILFVMLIGSYSELSEAIANQSALEKEISSGLQYKAELEEELDKKTDLAEIERIAVNRLGMVKAESCDRAYINIAGEDKIVVTEAESGTNENMSVVMSGMGRLFRNLVASKK